MIVNPIFVSISISVGMSTVYSKLLFSVYTYFLNFSRTDGEPEVVLFIKIASETTLHLLQLKLTIIFILPKVK